MKTATVLCVVLTLLFAMSSLGFIYEAYSNPLDDGSGYVLGALFAFGAVSIMAVFFSRD